MNILIISNGFGEDQIATNIIKALQKENCNNSFLAIPLVGPGDAYKKIGINPLIKNKTLPSGGFIRSIPTLIKEISYGLPTQILKQVDLLKKLKNNFSIGICIGDVYCLSLAGFNTKRKFFFLPTAKSDTFMPHNWLEYKLIKHYSIAVFPRDQITSNSFLKRNFKTYYFGNPMMDSLIPTQNIIFNTNEKPIIGILPGSRNEAYENLLKILVIIEKMWGQNKNFLFYLAKAPSLEIHLLKKYLLNSKWSTNKELNCIYLKHDKSCHINISEDFLKTIYNSNLIIGLSGTANEQAAYIKKTVICFPGTGPQSTKKRFLEQQKLMGSNIIFFNYKPEKIADFIINHIPEKQNQTLNPKILPAAPKIAQTILNHHY